jgi:hypothetical protein
MEDTTPTPTSVPTDLPPSSAELEIVETSTPAPSLHVGTLVAGSAISAITGFVVTISMSAAKDKVTAFRAKRRQAKADQVDQVEEAVEALQKVPPAAKAKR